MQVLLSHVALTGRAAEPPRNKSWHFDSSNIFTSLHFTFDSFVPPLPFHPTRARDSRSRYQNLPYRYHRRDSQEPTLFIHTVAFCCPRPRAIPNRIGRTNEELTV